MNYESIRIQVKLSLIPKLKPYQMTSINCTELSFCGCDFESVQLQLECMYSLCGTLMDSKNENG